MIERMALRLVCAVLIGWVSATFMMMLVGYEPRIPAFFIGAVGGFVVVTLIEERLWL